MQTFIGHFLESDSMASELFVVLNYNVTILCLPGNVLSVYHAFKFQFFLRSFMNTVFTVYTYSPVDMGGDVVI